MYKINDLLVYKNEVCKVIEIKEKFYRDMDYYVLKPINDETLKIEVPISTKLARDLLTKEEFEKLILNIPTIDVIKCNENEIENIYKELMQSGKHEDLIKIIKSAFLRNKERVDSKRKPTDKDENYFALAEKYLYTEIAVVYNISFDEAKNYVLDKVSKLER